MLFALNYDSIRANLKVATSKMDKVVGTKEEVMRNVDENGFRLFFAEDVDIDIMSAEVKPCCQNSGCNGSHDLKDVCPAPGNKRILQSKIALSGIMACVSEQIGEAEFCLRSMTGYFFDTHTCESGVLPDNMDYVKFRPMLNAMIQQYRELGCKWSFDGWYKTTSSSNSEDSGFYDGTLHVTDLYLRYVNPSNTLEENAAIFEDIMTNKVKRISNNIIRSGKDLVMTADVAKNKRLDRIQGHGFYLSESFVSTEGDSEPMGRRFSSSASASGANVLNRSMYGDVSESSEADANVLNHSTYDDARESSEAFDGEEYVPDCENEDGNEEYRGDEELPIPVNFWENMVIDWELAAKDRNDVEYFEKDDKSLPRHWANMINDWEEELRTNGSATTTAFNNMDAFSNSTNVTYVHPGIFSTPIRTATRLSPKK
jgi:hypothetical protein